MPKLPVDRPVEIPAEVKPISDYQLHVPATCFSAEPTESGTPPALSSQHNKQTDPEFEALEEEFAADIIQESLLPQSDFPTDPELYTKTSLSTSIM